ncbi:liver-expressed antimicrobial peptide 2 [Lampris incognitus]|uniref:liver-expressed antimicrobial peptide 2 n=1 Tax=Lampris incognitus TaxID=2546036 RepID=UPI0024B5C515|nr:liver-expressed antimicrobial peptide 2 [Lampris incognitus]
MQKSGFFGNGKATAALCLVLLMLAPQVQAGPVLQQGRVRSSYEQSFSRQVDRGFPALKRTVRMTPLWRILSSKPHGAHCQKNYECSTGLCRGGYCSFIHWPPSEPVKY